MKKIKMISRNTRLAVQEFFTNLMLLFMKNPQEKMTSHKPKNSSYEYEGWSEGAYEN